MAKWYLKWTLRVYLLMDLIFLCWIFIAWCSQYNSMVFFPTLFGMLPISQHLRSFWCQNRHFCEQNETLKERCNVKLLIYFEIVCLILLTKDISKISCDVFIQITCNIWPKGHNNSEEVKTAYFNVFKECWATDGIPIKLKKNTMELYWEQHAMNIHQKIIRFISK